MKPARTELATAVRYLLQLLAEKAPALKGHVLPFAGKVTHPKSGSYIQVISNVADAQHGVAFRAQRKGARLFQSGGISRGTRRQRHLFERNRGQ